MFERGVDVMRLEGNVALITGGEAGIGRACVELFAREGARVVIAELDEAAGESAHDGVAALGRKGLIIPTDVSEPDSVKQVVDASLDAFGRMDILYNNVGGSTLADGPVTTAPFEEFWRKMRLMSPGPG
jgi:NAD(P)-dependent dehydrogenase (short-subunit alcohol dehydrogenase family)